MAASQLGTLRLEKLISISLEPEEVSEMSVREDIIRLVDELQKSTFNVKTEVQVFPSGAIWLDVHCAGRLFILAYQPTGSYYGVDEFDLEEHGIGTHFRNNFDDFESAKGRLLSL